MHVVIGVDPAKTRLHAVIFDGDRYRLEKRTMPADIVLCATAAYTWIQRLVRETRQRYLHPHVVVAVEEPVFGGHGRRSANATLPGAIVQGGLLAGAYMAGAAVLRVNNTSWKKHIVGRGNATKQQVARHVHRAWPRLYRDAGAVQDWLDASCIAQYGLRAAIAGQPLTTRARRTKE